MIWKLSCTHQDGWTQHIFTVYQATTKMRMDHYWFSLAVGKAGGPGKASNQTLWLRHRYCNWVFMHMDVPERCHRLTAVSGEKQHDADTQTRVSFSLHIWRIWTEKKKKPVCSTEEADGKMPGWDNKFTPTVPYFLPGWDLLKDPDTFSGLAITQNQQQRSHKTSPCPQTKEYRSILRGI